VGCAGWAVFVFAVVATVMTFLATFAAGFFLDAFFSVVVLAEVFTAFALLVDLTVFFAVRVGVAAFAGVVFLGVCFSACFAIRVSQHSLSEYVDEPSLYSRLVERRRCGALIVQNQRLI
jgi:hypothetical protein